MFPVYMYVLPSPHWHGIIYNHILAYQNCNKNNTNTTYELLDYSSFLHQIPSRYSCISTGVSFIIYEFLILTLSRSVVRLSEQNSLGILKIHTNRTSSPFRLFSHYIRLSHSRNEQHKILLSFHCRSTSTKLQIRSNPVLCTSLSIHYLPKISSRLTLQFVIHWQCYRTK